MPFVKLDCGMLNSTIWFDHEARDVFITALLMASPWECKEPERQIEVGSLEGTGWSVPVGWYGFVAAAGPGIVARAGLPQDVGMAALERLGKPEPDSRTREFDGRRLVRVDGGYVVLNFMKYRDRDYTAAERSRRYRESKKREKSRVSREASRVASRSVTQAEAEADVEAEAVVLPMGDTPKLNDDPRTGRLRGP